MGAGGQLLESFAGAGLSPSADDEFGQHDRQAGQNYETQVDEDESGTAVFSYQVGKSPKVTQAHGRTGHGHQYPK